MTQLLTCSQVRDVDRRSIDEIGLAGIVLMENAGRGAADLLIQLGITGPVVICAGKGNNGGDGFVIARHLAIRRFETRVLLFCDPPELTGDAAANYHVLVASGQAGTVLGRTIDPNTLDHELATADWIVDALLGTGTQGTVREPYLSVISAINRAGKKVLAVDLPSGLDCDAGTPMNDCVRATHTATFVTRKIGFDAPAAAQYTGTVHVIDIGVPRCVIDAVLADSPRPAGSSEARLQ